MRRCKSFEQKEISHIHTNGATRYSGIFLLNVVVVVVVEVVVEDVVVIVVAVDIVIFVDMLIILEIYWENRPKCWGKN